MPIYEFECQSCASSFEELVRSQSEQVSCPKCQSGEVRRKMSTFARGGRSGGSDFTPSSGSSSGGCGGCSGGNCSSCH